jgi:hypothetical protein
VNASNRKQPSALEAGDDPLGLCKELDNDWQVLKKLSVGMYVEDEDGNFKAPCDALVFAEGDFVDVCVGFDIVSKKGRDGSMVIQVHLNIEHVLLLVAGPDVELVRPHCIQSYDF